MTGRSAVFIHITTVTSASSQHLHHSEQSQSQTAQTRSPAGRGHRSAVFLRAKFDWEIRLRMSSIRVLVVEDFAPFLEFICSTLREEPDLQIVGEVSDGLEAVRQAEKLKPDLILLDIGLPTLTGLEAARQIHKLAPESRIVFLTQESSADVVQEALNLGAWGYVVKTRAAIDLLPAVEAVLEGRRFVSGGLSCHNFTDASPRPPAVN
jgi:CheY-like chemotaxis protein